MNALAWWVIFELLCWGCAECLDPRFGERRDAARAGHQRIFRPRG